MSDVPDPPQSPIRSHRDQAGQRPPSDPPRHLRLSIPTKIFVGFSVVLILFASVLIFNFTRLGRLYEDVTVINRGLVPLRLTLFELEGELRSYAMLLAERDPVVLRSTVLASRVLFPFPRRIGERLDACVGTLDELSSQDLAIRHQSGFNRLRQIIEVLRSRNEVLAERSAELTRALEDDTFVGLEATRQALTEHLGRMQGQVRSLSGLTDAVVAEALDGAGRQERRNVLIVAITTAGAMIVALLVMLWAARTLRPLTRLTEGVKSIRGGAYETVEVPARNEIGVLAEEFNEMVRALQERDRRLREGREALERAYQMAVEAERLAAIGRLTSQITHEIRNPLSSIGLNIELLEDELRGGAAEHPEALALVTAITEEIDRLTAITHEYLQFARLPEPRLKPTDLNQLVGELLSFHDEELRQADVTLELELGEGIEPIQADPGQLRQAILNLVRNAREAMTRGGRLWIATRRVQGAVEVAVEDEGEGIEPDAVERIFDPFFTTKEQGTGLGLPLTRQIIAQHGGEVWCEAREPKGARFVVRLPA